MRLKLNKIKKIISVLLLCAMIVCENNIAGNFFMDNGIVKYMMDSGQVARGSWLWIDGDGDSICECYRFKSDGSIDANADIKGKKTNEYGQWVVDGIVQKVYKSTGEPLIFENAGLNDLEDTNKYINISSENTIKRLNATKYDLEQRILAEIEKERKQALFIADGPTATFSVATIGYILSRNATLDDNESAKKKKNRPIATKSEWLIIDDALKEEEIRYLSASESILAGKDMRKYVSTSNKYTESVKNVKIYGGDIWDDCICLQGNEASVKFTFDDFNFFTFEIAHQTHGESTADTYCCVELYLGGKSITSYDEFCDGEPELVEEWMDDGERTIELKAIVTGDAPGRKIYIRNARLRNIKEKKDRE